MKKKKKGITTNIEEKKQLSVNGLALHVGEDAKNKASHSMGTLIS